MLCELNLMHGTSELLAVEGAVKVYKDPAGRQVPGGVGGRWEAGGGGAPSSLVAGMLASSGSSAWALPALVQITAKTFVDFLDREGGGARERVGRRDAGGGVSRSVGVAVALRQGPPLPTPTGGQVVRVGEGESVDNGANRALAAGASLSAAGGAIHPDTPAEVLAREKDVHALGEEAGGDGERGEGGEGGVSHSAGKLKRAVVGMVFSLLSLLVQRYIC
jgi:hypothetical protein